jgi:hypothetical protein
MADREDWFNHKTSLIFFSTTLWQWCVIQRNRSYTIGEEVRFDEKEDAIAYADKVIYPI